jgi:putative ABC transport system permease protein
MLVNQLIRDTALAARNLRRTPAFTIAAALTLALGIGLSTAVFTIAEAIVLRRLPVADQDRLVVVTGLTPGDKGANYPLGYADGRDFITRTRSLESAGLVTYEGATPSVARMGDRLVRVRRAIVSGEYFATVGATPHLGRLLTAGDDREGAEPVAVISHAHWLNNFGADASVVGKRVPLHEDGITYTIVGVTPRGFDHPRGADMWVTIRPTIPAANLRYIAVTVIGRLKTGSGSEDARSEMTAFFQRPEAPQAYRALTGSATAFRDIIVGQSGAAVMVFAVAAGLLLLIACLNVANLLLVRGLGRVHEVAIRLALGGERRAIMKMLLRENLLLAILGAALGVVVAVLAVQLFVAFAPAGLPRRTEIGVDGTALLAGLAVSAIAMLVFGVLPAAAASRSESLESLRSGTRQAGSRRSRAFAEGAVALQIALATLVLATASLFGRTFLGLKGAELAFDSSRLTVAELAIRSAQYPDPASQLRVLAQLTAAAQAIPGVETVSPVVAVPFSGTSGWDGKLSAEGQSADAAAANPMLNMELVSTSYFKTFGLAALRGRLFTTLDREGATPVVILSEGAAQHFWPSGEPVGKRVLLGRGPSARAFIVVGIVPDTRYRDLRTARPSVYFPLDQSFFPFAPKTLVIRSALPVATVATSLEGLIARTAPGLEVARARPFEDFLTEPLAEPRLNAALLGLFASAAAALAGVGLFGVLATMVRQRRREFGVRLALGAESADLRRMVLGRAVWIAGVGIVCGLATSLGSGRAVSSLVHDARPSDAATLVFVVVGLAVCTLTAAALPAIWSTRIHPAIALRSD